MNRTAPGGALVPAVLVLCALAGCARGTPPDSASGSGSGSGDSARAGQSGAPAAAGDPAFLRGTVRVAGDSLYFTACGSAAEAWMADRTGGELTAAARSLGEGGAGVYVEVNGGATGAGTAAAAEFLRAAPIGEGGGCNRPAGAYLYHAFGEEPFWSVRVEEDSLVFEQPGEPARVAWPAAAVVASRGASGARTWTADAAGGRPAIALTVERGRCTDGLSGEVTAFRSRVTFDGRAMEGCARAGLASDEVR
jgi:uncharacterized membrane protein